MKKFLMAAMILFGGVCQAQVTEDTIIVSDSDSTYTIYVFWQMANDIDTVHAIEFGYDRLGLGWVTKMQIRDSSGVKIPSFVYVENPMYRYDVNRDGSVNIGDLVWMIKFFFGGL